MTEKATAPATTTAAPAKRPFIAALQALLREHGIDRQLKMPDFVLALYVKNCLGALSEPLNLRDQFGAGGPMSTGPRCSTCGKGFADKDPPFDFHGRQFHQTEACLPIVEVSQDADPSKNGRFQVQPDGSQKRIAAQQGTGGAVASVAPPAPVPAPVKANRSARRAAKKVSKRR